MKLTSETKKITIESAFERPAKTAKVDMAKGWCQDNIPNIIIPNSKIPTVPHYPVPDYPMQ